MQSLDSLLVLEIFCGSCRLSSACTRSGFQALALDHIPCARFKCLCLDLTMPDDQTRLLNIIEVCCPFVVWIAPPCGTASRAKSIPAYDEKGFPISLPLRSHSEPDGLSTLSGQDLIRVSSADALYRFTRAVVDLCQTMQTTWIIENPASSFFWETSWIQDLDASFPSIIFQPCMFGGDDPRKQNYFSRNGPAFLSSGM